MCLCKSTSRGLLFAAASSFLFSTCSLLAKFVRLNPAEISCIGFFGVIVISLPMAVLHYQQILPPKDYRHLFIARSVLGTIFLISCFRSVQLIPLGDASVIFATAPILTLILANIFLKEPCTSYDILMIFVIMCGVILVTQPTVLSFGVPMSNDYFLGITYAFLASLSEASGNIILRKLRTFHFAVIMFNHGVLSLIQTIFLLNFTTASTVNRTSFLPLVLLAVGTSLEQLLVTLALSIEQAGTVALVQASDIIYGYMFQVFFFEESVQFLPLMGAVMVTAVIIHMAKYGSKGVHRSMIVV